MLGVVNKPFDEEEIMKTESIAETNQANQICRKEKKEAWSRCEDSVEAHNWYLTLLYFYYFVLLCFHL